MVHDQLITEPPLRGRSAMRCAVYRAGRGEAIRRGIRTRRRRGLPTDKNFTAGHQKPITVTHTGGVLILGLLLTSVASLAGEQVLGWLGVISGLTVAAVGAGMLSGAARRLRRRTRRATHTAKAIGTTTIRTSMITRTTTLISITHPRAGITTDTTARTAA